jgi:hypothetical protein
MENWREKSLERTEKEENEAYVRPTHVPYKSRNHIQRVGARIRNEMHVLRKLVALNDTRTTETYSISTHLPSYLHMYVTLLCTVIMVLVLIFNIKTRITPFRLLHAGLG